MGYFCGLSYKWLMIMKKLFIFLPLIAVASACVDWKSGSGSEHFEYSWGKASMCIENPIAPGESLCYQIKFELDTLAAGSDLAAGLSQVLRDSVIYTTSCPTVREAMKAFADMTEEEWKKELAEIYSDELEYKDALQYYYSVEGHPLEESQDGVLSYQTTTDCYLGGAHGSYVVNYYNFDVKSGKLLSIKDVIPEGKEQEVLKAMEEQLCKDWEAKDLADLQEKTGITMLGDLYLTNNFFVKEDSILFLFNQYEIAPYAAGLISVTVEKPEMPD